MKQANADYLMLLTTILWGGTFVIVKSALSELPPSVFVLYRFTLALLVGLVVWRKSIFHISFTLLRRGLVLGLVFGVGFVLQTIGLVYTSVSSSAFITGTMVVFAPFVYWLVVRTRIRALHLVSVVVVIIGLWIFTEPESNGFQIGDVLTLIGAIVWSVYLTYIDIWTKAERENHHAMNVLVVLQFAVTMLLSLIVLAFTQEPIWGYNLTPSLIYGLVYCSVFAAVLTTWLQTRYQQYTHPVRAAVIFSVEPLVASVVAYFAISEGWTGRQALGAIVLIGVVVIPEIITIRRSRNDQVRN